MGMGVSFPVLMIVDSAKLDCAQYDFAKLQFPSFHATMAP
jgi:hypothetical protein